jgi:hypothetical protein
MSGQFILMIHCPLDSSNVLAESEVELSDNVAVEGDRVLPVTRS